jgi:hypothetical protein
VNFGQYACSWIRIQKCGSGSETLLFASVPDPNPDPDPLDPHGFGPHGYGSLSKNSKKNLDFVTSFLFFIFEK